MNRPFVRIAAILLFLTPALAQAQGLLVVVDPNEQVRLPRPIIIWPPHPIPHPVPPPLPPVSYKIKELDVQARLIDQVAQVQVSQTFVNTGSRPMEVAFVFPLPYDGAIDQMTLMIDGKEYPAKLLDAKEARRMYEEIVRKNRDPALLEWMGTGLFRTSVFPVPAGASRTVSLRYSQLCRKQEGLTDFLFPLSTAKYTSEAVEKVEIRATIESQEEIKNVYSPTHAVEIKRPDERHAMVTFSSKNEVPSSDFRLFYDVGKGKVSTRVLSYRPEQSQDGYFLLLASPEIKAGRPEAAGKDRVFVIDRSGSMSGKKIEQVQAALKYVLNNLRQGDLFNIVAYDNQVEAFRPELQRFDEETRKAALGFVEGLYAGGSTNIDGAHAHRPGPTARRQAAQLRDLPDRRPAHRRRDQRNEDRRQRQGVEQGPRAGLHLRRGLRREQPAAGQAGPRELRPERVRPAQRGHRGPRQQALQPHRVARDDRRATGVRLRRDARPKRAARSTASIRRIRSTCSPASNSWWSGATRSRARPR